jgi:hypothetical protein
MRTYDGNAITIQRLRDMKPEAWVRVLFSAGTLLQWMLDGIPPARIVEARDESNGVVLTLDTEPLSATSDEDRYREALADIATLVAPYTGDPHADAILKIIAEVVPGSERSMAGGRR